MYIVTLYGQLLTLIHDARNNEHKIDTVCKFVKIFELSFRFLRKKTVPFLELSLYTIPRHRQKNFPK